MTNQDRKWVLITGASGGIGRALVTSFIASGYNVIAADIVTSTYTEQNISALTLDLEQLALDSDYAEKFKKQVNDITSQRGITSLVNNAAVQPLNQVKEISRESWQSTMNVNVTGPLFLIQLMLDSLEANKGSVVNMSSIHASQTKPYFTEYATSKGALSCLTRNLAIELGSTVRINAIEPAAVDTPMLRAGFNGKEKQFSALESFHPLGRIAKPKDIAELAVYLCSEQASFIHGECIKATGGIHTCLHDPN